MKRIRQDGRDKGGDDKSKRLINRKDAEDAKETRMDGREKLAEKFLHQLISIWPDTSCKDPQNYFSKVSNFVTQDFDRLDLLNTIDKFTRIEKIFAEEKHNLIVEFLDTAEYPYRAELIEISKDEWRLRSLKEWCPACFGSGINMEKECTICGGMGWGVS